MKLTDIIIDKIRKNGPISFHDFMEMALYYPGLGYYTSHKEKFGKEGDYYTSVILSSLYGKMIGRQIEEMWMHMDKIPLTIVEYGAGTGALSTDILSRLKNNAPLYNDLNYYIIEKSESLREVQQKENDDKITWISSIEEIGGFNGVVITNEVLDNFAVHLVTMTYELMEIFVDYQDGFVEILRPAKADMKNHLTELNITLPENYRTEINLEAVKWMKEVAQHLGKGYVITIDYGYTKNDFFSPTRSLGTLACYYKHTITDTPYTHIGEKDITAHVNFSALHLEGEKYGLEYAGYCNQNYFLRSLGLANHLREIEMESSGQNRDALFQMNKLLLEMGDKFKVLIQRKGVKQTPLSGMLFSPRNFPDH